MPNWTNNTLTIRGFKPRVQAFLDKHLVEVTPENGKPYLVFDFETVIPYPEGFDASLSSGTMDGVAALLAGTPKYPHDTIERFQQMLDNDKELKAKYPTLEALAAAYTKNVELTGHDTWYGWNNANWGTKWNACDTEAEIDIEHLEGEVEVVIKFYTAWSEPLPIFEALAEQYPWLWFEYIARHEGCDDITGCTYNGDYTEDPNYEKEERT